MPRPYPTPHPHHIGPVLIGSVLAAAIVALLMPAVANAQHDDRYDNRFTYSDSDYYPDDQDNSYDVAIAPYSNGDEDDIYYNSPAYYNEDGVPYAGKNLAYDYLKGDYYRYQGQPAQDHRAREQDGYRDGVLQTRPRGYRAYRNYYDSACGCSRRAYYRVYNSWGEHEYRKLGGYNDRRTYSSSDRYSRY
ncbi:hypothetical protein [Asticcacaulis benevestitus]|uniref:Uncharacterized protein n=1 Tax=Asticcacaulis benevestitus DSM 16100 = ATCC BAA-896 TaxID=1121022 RepID=V4PYM9_9CAUL|nr:hypothetical protein [Asticcacaulis benevestitus]ESQ90665.1 hypothetical protein ABENE_11890 [Asticcacaulis benevestitus DSM 16100 = ATCC BAA-896]